MLIIKSLYVWGLEVTLAILGMNATQTCLLLKVWLKFKDKENLQH